MGRQTVGGLTADKTNEQKNSLSERGRSPQRGGQQGVRGLALEERGSGKD